MGNYNLSIIKEEQEQEQEEKEQKPEISTYICENTDGVLDPMEQMTYALNETQLKYGSVVVLKNAP
jgi:hypothetical protein